MCRYINRIPENNNGTAVLFKNYTWALKLSPVVCCCGWQDGYGKCWATLEESDSQEKREHERLLD